MIPVLVLMIAAAAPQTQPNTSPNDASAVKAAADHFALDLPAEQDPPPEVHLNAPDAPPTPVKDATDAQLPATDSNSSPVVEAPPTPSTDATMPAPPEAASSSQPASSPQDEGDPSKVDAAPISDTAIPASDVAPPANNAAAPAEDTGLAPDANATSSGDTAPASQPTPGAPDAAAGGDKSTPAAAAGIDAPAPDASAAAQEKAAPPPADNGSDTNSPSDKTTPPDTAADAGSADPAGKPLLHAGFTLDTPIGELIADPRAKAVLDKDLPGLSDDPNLSKFSALSLRKFQPLTGGQLTDPMLQQTANDLVLAASGNAPSSPNDLNPTTMPAPKASGRDRFSDGR